jgi:hypothetical protein
MRRIRLNTVVGSPGLRKAFSSAKKLTRDIIRQKIIDKAAILNTDGYVAEIKDNLIQTVSEEDFIADLANGNGNELSSKFKALYSSSALCVNFFGYFTRHLSKFELLGEGNFKVGKFEAKLPTGLKGTAPNLDFFLENQTSIIGVESKFLEILSPKQPRFSSSYSDIFLNTLHLGLSEIMNHYRSDNSKTYLDTSQLIKHSIGLIRRKGDKNANLIYLYWEPINANEFYEYSQHKKELVDFADRMKAISSISFYYFTYVDFYTLFANNNLFTEHLTNFKNRYTL